MTRVEILECTLRDGSYAIDYQFTADDTRMMTAAFADAGFSYIEIGHGLGLNASTRGKGEAAATDWEYIEAAAQVKGNSCIGMFFIPGIGRSEDLVKAKAIGLDFIRIGTDITRAKEADPYIRLAKNLGYFVSSNLMKTYVVQTDEFLQRSQDVLDSGADVVVIVDSAGSMLPQEVGSYVSSLRHITDRHIGFHGHNNLQLATANTLAAIECGADFVDSTMQGMGRSAGNAQTEILITILEKQGYETGVDKHKAMDIGAKLAASLMRVKRGVDHIEVISGIAQFHSSFLAIMEKVCSKYRVDLRDLIIEVSKIERASVTEKLAEDIAQQINATKKDNVAYNYIWDLKVGAEGSYGKSVEEQALQIAKEVKSLSHKTGKRSVFAISFLRDRKEQVVTFPYIRQNDKMVAAFAEIMEAEQGLAIVQIVLPFVDFLAINASDMSRFNINELEAVQRQRNVLFFDELSAKIDSAFQILLDNIGDHRYIALWGRNRFSQMLRTRMAKLPVKVCIVEYPRIGKKATEVLTNRHKAHVICEHWDSESHGDKVIDNFLFPGEKVLFASPSFMTAGFISRLQEKGIEVLRLDIRAGLSGQLVTAMESWELSKFIAGSSKYGSKSIVAGGVLGRRGDYVVDRIKEPTRLIGIADGEGGIVPKSLLSEEEQAAERDFRRRLLADKWIEKGGRI